ncbi:MAG: YraN family protein [Sporichthyaceae bacterium]
MRAKDALGKYGEDEAARFLTGRGLRILDRNWRCAEGEVDLVAADGDALVVCEVKTRRDDRFGGPLLAVTPEKVARLRRLAATLARERQWRGPIRIDVVAIWAERDKPVRIEHVRGVS